MDISDSPKFNELRNWTTKEIEELKARPIGDSINQYITDGSLTAFLDTDANLAANSDTRIATQKAVKTFIGQLNVNSAATVYTSKSCVSDADISMESNTYGTDNTVALQALLDLAPALGSLQIIVDGKYSMTGLRIHGNTRLSVMPGCGFILRPNSDKPMIRNYNQTAGAIVDKNIVIEGGIWNANGHENGVAHRQARFVLPSGSNWAGFVVAMEFCGVENFTLQDTVVIKSRNYGSYWFNWKRVRVYRTKVDVGNPPYIYTYDGHHFNGPGYDLEVVDFDVKSRDDGIALNANEPTAGDSANYFPPYFGTGGDIKKVLIDGVNFNDSEFGLRLLSSASRVDDITIRNLRGSTQKYLCVIDYFTQGADLMLPRGVGDFGSVLIEDVDVAVTASYEAAQAYIYVNSPVESLRVNNLRRRDFSLTNFPSLRVDVAGNVGQLICRDFNSVPLTGDNFADQIVVDGYVDQMRLSNSDFKGGAFSGTRCLISGGGKIHQFSGNDNLGQGLTDWVNPTVSVDSKNITDSDISPITTFLLSSGYAPASTGYDYYPAAGLNPGMMLKKTANPFASPVTVKTKVLFESPINARRDAILITRSKHNNLNWTTQTCYSAEITIGTSISSSTPQVHIYKYDLGVFTSLGAVGLNVFALDVQYEFSITTIDSGTTGVDIAVRLKRLSDNKYLSSAGAWQTTATDCLTYTDATGIRGAGYDGLSSYCSNGSGDTGKIEYRDFTDTGDPVPLLDSLSGVAAAYQLKKIRAGYSGACLRVRRTSDNTESDIGFDTAGILDWTAAAAFGADLRVVKWYKQSTGGSDLIQPAAAKQPTLDQTNKEIYFDGADDFLYSAAALGLSSTNKNNLFVRSRTLNAGALQFLVETSVEADSHNAFAAYYGGGADLSVYQTDGGSSLGRKIRAAALDTAMHTVSMLFDRGESAASDRTKVLLDGSASGITNTSDFAAATNFADQTLYVGMRAGTSYPLYGAVTGLIITTGATSGGDRTAIEASLAG